MGWFGQDLRQAVRQIRREPGFAAAVILTLSLAMGGLTAVFAIADPVLFRPLPYPEADRIVRLRAATEHGPGDLFTADYARLLEDRGAFEAVTTASLSLLGILNGTQDTPVTAFLTGVSPEFFDVFRVEPAIGRRFIPSDPDNGVAIVTHALWQRHFGGRPDIVGQPLVLRGSRPVTLEVIGVMPVNFVMLPEPRAADSADDVFAGLTKASISARMVPNPNWRSAPFARLRPGATRDEALTTLGRAMAIVERSGPEFGRVARKPVLEPLAATLYPGARTPMFMLLSVSAFVMLLAGANLAHLFMAHFGGRAPELATRAALGASRARLVRLLVLEAAVLAAAGTAGALLAGEILKDLVVRMLPASSQFEAIGAGDVDARVVAVIGAIMVAGLAGFGMLPAAGTVRGDLHRSMRLARAHGAGGRLRSGLVLAQTATAVAVLLTALLLAASFVRLARQDFGFNPVGVQSLTIASPVNISEDHARKRHTSLEMKRRVETLTGQAVALAGGIPGHSLPTAVGRADAEPRAWRAIGYPVTAEFFEIFEIQLVRGRLITRDEGLSGVPVIVIDDRAAALSWPGQNPIGKAMRDSRGTVRTVIGVVRTLQTRVFAERFQRAAAFFPIPAVHERPYTLLWRGPASASVERSIRSEMRAVDPQATALVAPLRVLESQLEGPRFLAVLLGALGALAVVLTIVGLYGVVSHGVAQRTREMGIRIALGAEALRIARLIVGQTLRPAAMGVALGLALSLWWTETLRAMLYGFSPHDWRVFAAAGLLVLALVALACLLPIRRATRIDPMIALKTE
ncbi:MAG: ABC transporter permease [Vicinamibacterales bacterium]